MTIHDLHQRARQSIADRALQLPADSDIGWLERHLEECADCAAHAASMSGAVAALRTTTEMPSSTLVRATERIVRIHAAALRERESRRSMLVVSSVLAATWGALLQPVLWRLLGWVGAALDLPDAAWQAAFVAAWVLPGIVAALLLIHQPAGPARPDAGERTLR